MAVLFTLAASLCAVLALVFLIGATQARSYELLVWAAASVALAAFLAWGAVRQMTRRH